MAAYSSNLYLEAAAGRQHDDRPWREPVGQSGTGVPRGGVVDEMSCAEHVFCPFLPLSLGTPAAGIDQARRVEDNIAMSAALKWNLVSVEEYLAGELVSPIKHEYIAGVVYAMAGARNAHNLIAANCLGELRSRLRGKRCRAYSGDTKIRVRLPH